MGWEERKGNWYYYQKRRIGERVVSEYIGRGELANLVARLDGIDRMRSEDKRRKMQSEQEELDTQKAQVYDVFTLIRSLTHAALLASNYHMHKGQWRKRREQQIRSIR